MITYTPLCGRWRVLRDGVEVGVVYRRLVRAGTRWGLPDAKRSGGLAVNLPAREYLERLGGRVVVTEEGGGYWAEVTLGRGTSGHWGQHESEAVGRAGLEALLNFTEDDRRYIRRHAGKASLWDRLRRWL